MPTYRLTIEYDGSHFCGWQTQPNGIQTVQGSLENALAVLLKQRVHIQGAGRTDAGVHALGQCASFSTEVDIGVKQIARSLCALAGPSVSVVDAQIAPKGFNARLDTIGKHYRYLILNRRSPSPIQKKYTKHVVHKLDVQGMQTSAAFLVGEHDFAAFRAADCQRETTVRTLTSVTVSCQSGELISIDVKGDAFLKNMVRIIAGTLIDIGRGRLGPEAITNALDKKDRKIAGHTAEACGLTLMEVFYPEGWIRKDRLIHDRPKQNSNYYPCTE